MPTKSSASRFASSTSSSDSSSPPNTRWSSCLAGRLCASAAVMMDPSSADQCRGLSLLRHDSNDSFTLSLKRFGSLLWQGDLRRPLKTAAQELAELGERGGPRKTGFAAPLPARAGAGAPPPQWAAAGGVKRHFGARPAKQR